MPRGGPWLVVSRTSANHGQSWLSLRSTCSQTRAVVQARAFVLAGLFCAIRARVAPTRAYSAVPLSKPRCRSERDDSDGSESVGSGNYYSEGDDRGGRRATSVTPKTVTQKAISASRKRALSCVGEGRARRRAGVFDAAGSRSREGAGSALAAPASIAACTRQPPTVPESPEPDSLSDSAPGLSSGSGQLGLFWMIYENLKEDFVHSHCIGAEFVCAPHFSAWALSWSRERFEE
jgi:hypothetical protein